MKYAFVVVAAAALLASACTETKPISPDLAKMGHLIYAKPVQGVPATAVFVRDIGFAGLGKTATLYIDGEVAAELETSEKVSVELTAGNHSFGVVLAPATGLPAATIDERLESGQSYVYRLASDANGMRVERAP
jgi:hypothetical protein